MSWFTRWNTLSALMGICGIGAVTYVIMNERREDTTPPLSAQIPAVLSQATSPQGLTPTHSIRISRAPSSIAPEGFKERFGNDLEIRWDPQSGRLATVRGIGRPAPGKFDPTDPQAAIVRARDVLNQLGATHLGQPQVRTSSYSAQVVFRVAIDGVPLAPVGNVTVHLGAHGEVTGVYSDAPRDVTIENQRTLSPDQALQRVPSSGSNMKTFGGQSILWVEQPHASQPTARHAYEYHASGFHYVIDAQTGAILFKGDRRYFLTRSSKSSN